MEKKPSSFSFFFKRLNKKGSSGGGVAGVGGSRGGAWRPKWKSSAGWRWKRSKFNLHHWFVDSFIFKIVQVFEAIALVGTLVFFYLCCGCHF